MTHGELPSYPDIPPETEVSLDAAQHDIEDDRLTLDIARDFAKAYPRFSEEAGKLALKLYGDDPKGRDAFLNGVELVYRIRKKQVETEHLEQIFHLSLSDGGA